MLVVGGVSGPLTGERAHVPGVAVADRPVVVGPLVQRTRDLGQVALSLGLLTAVVALTTAAGQIERGANRIYGIDQDRPAPQKYRRALPRFKGSSQHRLLLTGSTVAR